VNQTNLHKRFSAGCVNVPNWPVQLGDYYGPLDELIFRWFGGMTQPEANVYEFGTKEHPTVWIYVVDSLAGLYPLPLSARVSGVGISWADIIHQVENTPLTVPPSFYENA
jgi:hypothetical protein